jgi:hypothetical protein
MPQFGLVAEEVEKISSDLVIRDKNNLAFTVRYEAVNAMLLHEFRKEHAHIKAQDVPIATQQAEIAALTSEQKEVVAQRDEIAELRTQLDVLAKAVANN